ncbi:MAG: hypothetical protein II118_05445 [Ruminococcus sp.]|jgi:opacity protein-like surface antigen|uniref:hypothetical protein n=1 Tax=uncultured Ruminococcus sp. TaxID=165186 RepID=UPI002931ABE0|nr:hypothetical protein [uncultured Ruminococcus sp.]MBQ1239012.1 hypothetical protein [Ruminococcus sp.]MBQ1309416.1 hypothetical protein [Ruminococcus sp.]MBQ1381525.1 hypothetical protein [Ruminococcus sp.]MBQ1600652.1 hypothetical protein [Ruminococcus sp.]MBQ1686163.1 hypothetical protein [Ruminococcus sp.]
MKKNRKSMKKKVLATVLAAVCAVSAIGAASAVSVGAASVSASSSVGASGKACRFDMYGTSWSYRTSMGYVAVSCNYDWRTQHAQFTIKGVSAGVEDVILLAKRNDGKWNCVPVRFTVDQNLNVTGRQTGPTYLRDSANF